MRNVHNEEYSGKWRKEPKRLLKRKKKETKASHLLECKVRRRWHLLITFATKKKYTSVTRNKVSGYLLKLNLAWKYRMSFVCTEWHCWRFSPRGLPLGELFIWSLEGAILITPKSVLSGQNFPISWQWLWWPRTDESCKRKERSSNLSQSFWCHSEQQHFWTNKRKLFTNIFLVTFVVMLMRQCIVVPPTLRGNNNLRPYSNNFSQYRPTQSGEKYIFFTRKVIRENSKTKTN